MNSNFEKSCETCAKRDDCKRIVGIMFGFCETDYVPEKKQNREGSHDYRSDS